MKSTLFWVLLVAKHLQNLFSYHFFHTNDVWQTSFLRLVRSRLYWCESDIVSRWVHRESNLMFTLNSNKNQRKKECIPVGCIPLACWPYPTMHCQGVYLSGVYLPKRGVPAQEGCTCPGGCTCQGTPPLWTEWLTDRCKNITIANFVCGR